MAMEVARRHSTGSNIEQIDSIGMSRITQLAKPKRSQCIWVVDYGPKMNWGTQDTMWPISKKALGAKATGRVEELSRSKKDFKPNPGKRRFTFSCGRESVIWDVESAALKAAASARVEMLANHRPFSKQYVDDRHGHTFSCGRESPIWTTATGKTTPNISRIEELAKHRGTHSKYRLPRDVESKPSRGAMSATATPRLENLSRPKSRNEGPFRDPMWPVTGARTALVSPRQLELATPKPVPEGYLVPRPSVPEVPRSARRATATPRTQELSQPIIRASMDYLQFNPDAFTVSELARRANCSNRVLELSHPIKR